MDSYCTFKNADYSTDSLLILGSQLSVMYESPIVFSSITLPTGPVADEGP